MLYGVEKCDRLMDAQIVTLTVSCGGKQASQVWLPVVSAS
jgi:hypothetical protein